MDGGVVLRVLLLYSMSVELPGAEALPCLPSRVGPGNAIPCGPSVATDRLICLLILE